MIGVSYLCLMIDQLLLVGCLILAMSLGELQPDSASSSELESYNPQYNLCVGICVAQGIGAADDSKDFTMDLKVNFFFYADRFTKTIFSFHRKRARRCVPFAI